MRIAVRVDDIGSISMTSSSPLMPIYDFISEDDVGPREFVDTSHFVRTRKPPGASDVMEKVVDVVYDDEVLGLLFHPALI